MAEITVVDNPAASRFEAFVDGKLAGFCAYVPTGTVLILPHTVVDTEFEGQGVGSALVRGTLDSLRAQGKRVYPTCSFVSGFIRKHPEYRTMVGS